MARHKSKFKLYQYDELIGTDYIEDLAFNLGIGEMTLRNLAGQGNRGFRLEMINERYNLGAVDIKKIRMKMFEKDYLGQELAKEIGMSRRKFYKRMAETTTFSKEEVKKIENLFRLKEGELLEVNNSEDDDLLKVKKLKEVDLSKVKKYSLYKKGKYVMSGSLKRLGHEAGVKLVAMEQYAQQKDSGGTWQVYPFDQVQIIRNMMKEYDYRAIEIGELLGLQQTTINNRLNYHTDFTKDELIFLADLFYLDEGELLK